MLGATPADPRRHVRRRSATASRLADTVIGLSASCDDTTPLRYADWPAGRPRHVRARRERPSRLSREAGATVHVGPVVTSGIFYDPDLTNVPRWKRLGHLGIEMEAAMLYTVAAVQRVEALAMMTVSDILGATEDERERISDDAAAPGRRRHDPRRLPRRRVATRLSSETDRLDRCGRAGSRVSDEAELLHRVALLDELGRRRRRSSRL